MTATEAPAVIQDRSGGILILSLNRPESRNAMSGALVATLLDIFALHARDPACRAIILTGAGPGFCAGSDLRELAALPPSGRSRFEADSGTLARRIAAMPVPVIAAVEQFAIGGGLTLAAVCDIIVSQQTAKWSLPEAPIGLFPAWGLWAVEARIGRARAQRLSWGIETIDGDEAQRIGLVDMVDDRPLPRALEIARQLADVPPEQVRQVKSYFARALLGEADDREANRLFMDASASPAARETFKRFGRPR